MFSSNVNRSNINLNTEYTQKGNVSNFHRIMKWTNRYSSPTNTVYIDMESNAFEVCWFLIFERFFHFLICTYISISIKFYQQNFFFFIQNLHCQWPPLSLITFWGSFIFGFDSFPWILVFNVERPCRILFVSDWIPIWSPHQPGPTCSHLELF